MKMKSLENQVTANPACPGMCVSTEQAAGGKVLHTPEMEGLTLESVSGREGKKHSQMFFFFL